MKTYLSHMLETCVSTAVLSSEDRRLRSLAVQISAATYTYMPFAVHASQPPLLSLDVGDGALAMSLRDLEDEPEPADIDRMASAVVGTVEELPRLLVEARKRSGQSGRPAPLKKAGTKKFARQKQPMWGDGGPQAFGFHSLVNDARADVPRLLELFDLVDLNGSGDISLDEMQWFLELQGQVMKR